MRHSLPMNVSGAGDRQHSISPSDTRDEQNTQINISELDKRRLLIASGAIAISATFESLFVTDRCVAVEGTDETHISSSGDSTVSAAPSSTPGPRAFLDIAVDGEPYGRIVIAVDPDLAPIGAQRFLDLAQGKEGVSYRRSRITLLDNGYIQAIGVRSLSYKASGRTSIAGGPDTEALESEMASRCHDKAGIVSLIVKPAQAIETKDKLVAVKGQFITVTEVLGEVPNGSGFAITTGPAPQLDTTNLIIGHVISGQDVVDRLASLPRVKNNSESPFFKAGKAAGDKRAKVAERAFGKPFSKIVIENSGLL